ncbi:MAG: hypothetical protein GY938_27005 [Ketobacter sp.]|nr:hypothetical protein [Ketobacter sp.]
MGKVPRIVDSLKNYPHVHINDLVDFQGELKDLHTREYKKLRKSILEHGFFMQFFAWPHDGVNYILDGHQRKRVFIGEGWLIDVPVQFIQAATYEEAKEKLMVISSQYGKITQEGYDEFTFDMNPNWLQETVHFDALPFVFGAYDSPPPPDEWKEYDENAANDVEYITCPHCDEKFPK